MGGIPVVAPPKPSEAEVIAQVIEVGRNVSVPNPHTCWVVNDPSPSTLFFHDRSDVDNICYAIPTSHLVQFHFSPVIMKSNHTAFYAYKDREAAVEDALLRLARVGRRCAFCMGVVHPATGCQYTETFIVCGTCVQPYVDVMGKLPKSGLPGFLQEWTAKKAKRAQADKCPTALGFFESAGLFMGRDNRKVFT